jgi:hypothetical protein
MKKKVWAQEEDEHREDGFILSKFYSFEMGLHHQSKVNYHSW